MQSIEKQFIQVEAIPGGGINNCLKDSIILSVKENCNVKLIHNTHEYLISIDEIYKTVEK